MFVFLSLGFVFDGEWSLRLSFDIFTSDPIVPVSPSFPPCLLLCFFLSVYVSPFLLCFFPFLVSGSRPPLNCCKTQEVWSVRRVLVVPPSLPARPS